MSIAERKKKTLMRRRKTAIILSAALALILIVALVLVMDYVQTLVYEDVDGTSYYIRKRDGVFAMYDGDRQLLPYDEQYSCYVTEAGTLVKVDPETGAYEVFAVVATEDYEVVGTNSRILLFPRVRKADMLSLEVHNTHGEYTFIRLNEKNEPDPEADFVIRESPTTAFSPEKFTTLHVGAGYAISLEKLVDPIRDENGEYTEYGLAPETRLRTADEYGQELSEPEEYTYEPSYYILTQKDGTQHKVIIGDRLLTGDGYYAQYVEVKDGEERALPGVYVLDLSTGDYVSYAIEEYVTPMITYSMSMTNYYDVEDFVISRLREGALPEQENPYETKLSFSFLDVALREGTVLEAHPYEFHLDMNGFTPTTSSVETCLSAMYSPTFAERGVKILAPTDEELARYGLAALATGEGGKEEYVPFSTYRISFDYDVLDTNNQYAFTVSHSILISRPDDPVINPDENYFAYSALREYVKNEDGSETVVMTYSSNMIVEIESYSLEFLEWEPTDWVNSSYINGNLGYVSKIELSAGDYNATFELDNSRSPENEDGTVNANYLKILASDSSGRSRETFNIKTYSDVNGQLWVITASDIRIMDLSTQEALRMPSGTAYYENNKLGKQALCSNEYITCKGYKVEVTADYIREYATNERGEIVSLTQEIARYDTDLFRLYYETLLYATIVDAYEPDEEELEKILSQEILTLTITTTDKNGSKTNTYSFYRISSRKAYITINGKGGFYVYKNRVDKFLSDAQKFFDGQPIAPTEKN